MILIDLNSISNGFNKTLNMVKKIGEKISVNRHTNFKRYFMLTSLVLLPTDRIEIINIIHDLKNNKSPGLDKLRTETLKSVSEYFVGPLVFIIDECMYVGYWPQIFMNF